jgi:hypothetical protein
MRLLLPMLLLVPLSAAPALADAPEGEAPRIYRWVDENGVAHYTTDEDRIPASLRRRFGVPTRPLERTPLEADAPEAPPPAPAPVAPAPVAPEAWASQERGDDPAPPAPAPAEAPEERAEPELPGVSAGLATDADRLARVELRIAELSAAIAADEDMLSAWLADPETADVVALGETPQFREIAARLPKRIQELEALVSERDALAAATP